MQSRLLFLLLSVTVVSPARPAEAYTLRRTDAGALIRWQQDRIVICLDESLAALGDEKEVGDAVAEAFATWEGSDAFPATFEVVDCSMLGDPGDEPRNEITAVDGPWPYPSHANAVTILSFDSDTGAILEADVVFNAELRWGTSDVPSDGAYDLLDTAAHEVGHLVGLGHSENEAATMFEGTTRGSIERRTLHDDDIRGLNAAYGTAMPLGRTVSAGCSASSSQRSSRLDWLLVVLSLVALRGRRLSTFWS